MAPSKSYPARCNASSNSLLGTVENTDDKTSNGVMPLPMSYSSAPSAFESCEFRESNEVVESAEPKDGSNGLADKLRPC